MPIHIDIEQDRYIPKQFIGNVIDFPHRLLQLYSKPSNLYDDQPGVQGGLHQDHQEGLLLPSQQGLLIL